MRRSALPLSDRARGLLLGLAAGHALGRGAETLGSPAALRARYPGGISEIVRTDSPASPWADEVALALLLAEELLEPEVDLRRLTDRWIGWWRRDGRGLDRRTAEALEHIARHDLPLLARGEGEGGAPLARCLPLALPAHRASRTLVSGTYHTVFLTHPDPVVAWGAVAVNVAAASFLRGRRDFLPDVIEALRANDAPAELLDRIRRVPFIGRDDLDPPARTGAVPVAEAALWLAYHEPVLERGLVWLASRGGAPATATAVTGALLGARDGESALPGAWVEALPEPGYLRSLAKRLVTPREAEV